MYHSTGKFLVVSIDSKKLHEETKYVINVHINHNSIIIIALNICIDVRDEGYGAIYTIDKNTESGYYLVKWTIESYTLQFSQNS